MDIILYGINSLKIRRMVEHCLCEEATIIGYCDTYLREDIVDNKKYIDASDLGKWSYDYIVLCIENISVCYDVKRILVENGINVDKIIFPFLFVNDYYIYQKNMVNLIREKFVEEIQGLIFGLSYSLRGIDKKRLKTKFFDFSWHGLDLYYNHQLLKYAVENNYINYKIQKAILVFPYDYFNYDSSMSWHTYEYGQMLPVSELDDYHNYWRITDKDVNSHIVCMKLFGKKYMQYFNANENIYNRFVCREKYTLGHTWCKQHAETIQENLYIFNEFIGLLSKYCDSIVAVVPPFCISCITNLEEMKPKRKFYYEVMKKHNIEIFDFIDVFSKDFEQELLYFADATHLNYEGACAFTEIINEYVLKV